MYNDVLNVQTPTALLALPMAGRGCLSASALRGRDAESEQVCRLLAVGRFHTGPERAEAGLHARVVAPLRLGAGDVRRRGEALGGRHCAVIDGFDRQLRMARRR
jgi:hypothetical protein